MPHYAISLFSSSRCQIMTDSICTSYALLCFTAVALHFFRQFYWYARSLKRLLSSTTVKRVVWSPVWQVRADANKLEPVPEDSLIVYVAWLPPLAHPLPSPRLRIRAWLHCGILPVQIAANIFYVSMSINVLHIGKNKNYTKRDKHSSQRKNPRPPLSPRPSLSLSPFSPPSLQLTCTCASWWSRWW